MSGARTVWHDLEARRTATASRQRAGLVLAAGLLIAMCVAEMFFLRYVASSATVDMMMAAEGIPIGGE